MSARGDLWAINGICQHVTRENEEAFEGFFLLFFFFLNPAGGFLDISDLPASDHLGLFRSNPNSTLHVYFVSVQKQNMFLRRFAIDLFSVSKIRTLQISRA